MASNAGEDEEDSGEEDSGEEGSSGENDDEGIPVRIVQHIEGEDIYLVCWRGHEDEEPTRELAKIVEGERAYDVLYTAWQKRQQEQDDGEGKEEEEESQVNLIRHALFWYAILGFDQTFIYVCVTGRMSGLKRHFCFCCSPLACLNAAAVQKPLAHVASV